ncbi:LuxR C-terminal-related transcriptional regulator [Kutzneria buriramensis]|uniref:LuxR family maltose regulon positive regulatory protein n=2 Tax=Kutzneria buriramensis TaxID=1045776 RepID=A0A3E0GY93_9PSEU|nr:LuxR family maltose regulon positive regulatory protein [Kutzneria buriramensis]
MPAKLRVAEIRTRVVLRQRLLDRLYEGTRGPLTLVTASAGAGKTVLASSWVSAGRVPGRVAWISLECGDDQPGVFWTYVLEGLARSGVPLPALRPPARSDTTGRSLLTRLAAWLSDQDEPSVLVLDNVEVLGSSVLDGVDFLLRHASPQLRLVAIGRTAPPLPLHRYRLAGWLTEVQLDELAFTEDEAESMMAEHGARVGPEAVRILVRRTEGWAAGLRMAAMSLQDRDPHESEEIVRRFGGGRQDVAEYFLAEVFDAQPPGVREFLLRTSVADLLPTALADELSGRDDSARLLHDLVQANVFVLPADDGAVRYHSLYRDLLRAQLGRRPAEEVVRLHQTAARWLMADGQTAAAAIHAAAAGEWGHAATLAIDGLAVGGVLAGTDDDLTEALAGIPDEVGGPHGSVLRAALAVVAGDRGGAAPHLAQARRVIAGNPPTRENLAVRMVLAAVEVLSADVDRAAEAAVSFDALAAEAGPPAEDLSALVHARAGASLMWAGELDKAEDTLLAAARSAEVAELGRLRAHVLGHLALLNATQGRLRRAGDHAGAAAEVADEVGLSGVRRPAAIDAALAWIHFNQHDLRTAQRHARARPEPDDPVTAAALAVLRDRVLHSRADRAADRAAPAWLVAAVRPTRDGVVTVPVESWLRRASTELDRGRDDLARRALGHALHLAAPESLRRPIAEAPPRLRRFLSQDQELLHQHHWLGGAFAVVPTMRSDDDSRPAALVEPLTEREHEVLGNMAALLSTDEIAQAMFVSVNTVKTHIRSILRKLSVNRRNDAIRRARELGLLRTAADGAPTPVHEPPDLSR